MCNKNNSQTSTNPSVNCDFLTALGGQSHNIDIVDVLKSTAFSRIMGKIKDKNSFIII